MKYVPDIDFRTSSSSKLERYSSELKRDGRRLLTMAGQLQEYAALVKDYGSRTGRHQILVWLRQQNPFDYKPGKLVDAVLKMEAGIKKRETMHVSKPNRNGGRHKNIDIGGSRGSYSGLIRMRGRKLRRGRTPSDI